MRTGVVASVPRLSRWRLIEVAVQFDVLEGGRLVGLAMGDASGGLVNGIEHESGSFAAGGVGGGGVLRVHGSGVFGSQFAVFGFRFVGGEMRDGTQR